MFRKAFQKQIILKIRNNYCRRTATVSNANEKNIKPIAYWLLGLGGLVAGMVSVGGITRLTRSGLSMTDWKLTGCLPPMTPEDWEKEFTRYKQFPEWQQRQSMTVEEFKYIYFWEYGHRMMGRFIGVAFAVPFTYFAARGMIPRSLYPRLGLLFSLGGTQGLIGWWMVKSGLEMDPEQKKEIRVSPYRLATHLGMAFTTYTALIWTGLDLLSPGKLSESLTRTNISAAALNSLRSVRTHSMLNLALVGTTAFSGAFVAGMDAGLAFNTFPKMGDRWIPDEILSLQPLWRNFFENTATVQFDHRMLALTTLSSIALLYHRAKKTPVWSVLPRIARTPVSGSLHMGLLQVTLGVATLLTYVPIELAVMHQAGSLALLTFTAWSCHSLRLVVARIPVTTIAKNMAK